MKKTAILSIFLFFAFTNVFANGVIIDRSKINSYVRLTNSTIHANVENQVAIVTTSQTFLNTIKDSLKVRYAFPLPEGASAIKLRFKLHGKWYFASFSATPQDTSQGGGGGSGGATDAKLSAYLGLNPLYYTIDSALRLDSNITVELTYVELLKYKFGNVYYNYPNNYSTLQTAVVNSVEFKFNLISARNIINASLNSHIATQFLVTTNAALIKYNATETALTNNFAISYSLDLTQLGISSLSTYTPDSVQKDEYGRGFFALVAEPNPTATTVINKVFTLIIDKSGSMSYENRMTNAKEAAKYIVNNLNPGDKFNIISFETTVTSFRPRHVNYTNNSRDSSIIFINNFSANGSTNISGAFDVAVPQFSTADTSTANIIIFITDGDPTVGITNKQALISHINTLLRTSEKNINLFSFGIGTGISRELLSNIALNNNGLAEFLENNNIESVISDFYNTIRNPVLLNTRINFLPAVTREIYPLPLPNLYKGSQMVMFGRYATPGNVAVSMSGKVFNQNVTYNYNTNFIDSNVVKNQFLTKLWAKSKIDYLTSQYYQYLSNTTKSDSIKNAVIDISLNYGVISIFTSFQGTGGGGGGGGGLGFENIFNEWSTDYDNENEFIRINSLSPNPCYDYFNLALETKDNVYGEISISIVNVDGVEVYKSVTDVTSNNKYTININTRDLNSSKGVHFVLVKYGDKTLVSKVIIF